MRTSESNWDRPLMQFRSMRYAPLWKARMPRNGRVIGYAENSLNDDSAEQPIPFSRS